MKKGNFGETLRREREMRGVSLDEISNATRISTRFLLALENEQWHELPGGVFNRGFVRSIARFLGIDEDTLVAEYALVTNDKPQVAVWATGHRAPNRTTPVIAALVLIALVAGGVIAWREAAPWLGPRISELWARFASPGSSTGVAAANPGTPPAATPPAPASPQPEELVLRIQAGKATAVTVVADGTNVFDRSLDKDEQQTFRARQRFDVTAREPLNLFITLNGQDMPPLGQPGQTASKTYTRADLKPQEGSH